MTKIATDSPPAGCLSSLLTALTCSLYHQLTQKKRCSHQRAPLETRPQVMKRDLADRLRPGGLDPVGGRRRLVVAVAGLRPIGRRRDVADRDGDDAGRVPNREGILRHVLAEAGDRVLVALVIVRPDIDVAGRRIVAEAFELA